MSLGGDSVELTNCEFSENWEGAIIGRTVARVTDCAFVNNARGVRTFGADGGEGTQRFTRCTISENSEYGLQFDGGNRPTSSSLAIEDSIVADNEGTGIQIYPVGHMTPALEILVRGSTIHGNIDGIRLGGNVRAEIANSTLSDNRSSGLQLYESGHDRFQSVVVRHSTIANNGKGIGMRWDRSVMNISIGSSIFSGNSGDCDFRLEPISEGFNLTDYDPPGLFPSTCDFVDLSDEWVEDAMLSELADHGGPTPVHMPLEGSPVIDMGGECSRSDQRHYRRPADGDGDGVAYCDCGAVEVNGEPPISQPNWPMSDPDREPAFE